MLKVDVSPKITKLALQKLKIAAINYFFVILLIVGLAC